MTAATASLTPQRSPRKIWKSFSRTPRPPTLIGQGGEGIDDRHDAAQLAEGRDAARGAEGCGGAVRRRRSSEVRADREDEGRERGLPRAAVEIVGEGQFGEPVAAGHARGQPVDEAEAGERETRRRARRGCRRGWRRRSRCTCAASGALCSQVHCAAMSTPAMAMSAKRPMRRSTSTESSACVRWPGVSLSR